MVDFGVGDWFSGGGRWVMVGRWWFGLHRLVLLWGERRLVEELVVVVVEELVVLLVGARRRLERLLLRSLKSVKNNNKLF